MSYDSTIKNWKMYVKVKESLWIAHACIIWFGLCFRGWSESNRICPPLLRSKENRVEFECLCYGEEMREINSSRWLRVEAKKKMANAIKEGIRKRQKWIAEDWQKSKPRAQTCPLHCMQMKGWRGGGGRGPVGDGERERDEEIRSDRLFLF